MVEHVWHEGLPEEEQEKLSCLERARVAIAARLERAIDNTEARALAFLLEKTWEPGRTAESFLDGVCGVKLSDAALAVALKIHNAIYAAKSDDFVRRSNSAASTEVEERQRVELVARLSASGHADTVANFQRGEKVYLGGIAEFMLPRWAREVL